jgi:YbbR domain-containing protein
MLLRPLIWQEMKMKDDNKKKESAFGNFLQNVKRLLTVITGYLSRAFDRIIFSNKASLIASGILAAMICAGINYQELSFLLFQTDAVTYTLTGIPVELASADDQNYEITGVPATADITVTGDSADIQLIRTQNSASVICNLKDASEGTNVIELTASGIPSDVEALVSPETVEVTMTRMYSKTFFITADLIVGAGQSVSFYQTPKLSTRSVTIKATKDKLNSIRTVRAIVDTSGHEGDFEATCPLVAYDSSGKQVKVEITPSEVTATVELASSVGASSSEDTESAEQSEDTSANTGQ